MRPPAGAAGGVASGGFATPLLRPFQQRRWLALFVLSLVLLFVLFAMMRSPSSPSSMGDQQSGPMTCRRAHSASVAAELCSGTVKHSDAWHEDRAIERNVFFVWIGPASVPERALYAVAAAAHVYGPEWDVRVVTSSPAPALVERVNAMLVHSRLDQGEAASPERRCGHARVHHDVVDVAELLVRVGWSGEQAAFAADLVSKGGRDNLVTVSDIVRVALVYESGGVYLDLDAIALVPITRPTIGVDCASDYECFAAEPAGFVVERGRFPVCKVACMCNCVFAMPRGHAFLRRYLDVIANSGRLQANHWGVVGPRLMFEQVHAVRAEKDVLDDVDGMNMNCLMGARGNSVDAIVNYHYHTAGNSAGHLPPQAAYAYAQARLCTCHPPPQPQPADGQ